MDTSYITYPMIFLAFLMAMGLLLRPLRFMNVVPAIIIAELGHMTLFIYMLHKKLIFTYPDCFLLLIPIEISMGPLLYLHVQILIKKKIQAFKPSVRRFQS